MLEVCKYEYKCYNFQNVLPLSLYRAECRDETIDIGEFIDKNEIASIANYTKCLPKTTSVCKQWELLSNQMFLMPVVHCLEMKKNYPQLFIVTLYIWVIFLSLDEFQTISLLLYFHHHNYFIFVFNRNICMTSDYLMKPDHSFETRVDLFGLWYYARIHVLFPSLFSFMNLFHWGKFHSVVLKSNQSFNHFFFYTSIMSAMTLIFISFFLSQARFSHSV